MTSSKKHFEAFADHTLLKHTILGAYLQRWAFKLLQWGGAGDTVYFVDGFAGAGCDKQGNPGSPVIACRIAQQVRSHFASKGREVRLGILALEANPRRLEVLEDQLAPFRRTDPDVARTLRGSVSEHIEAICDLIGGHPALFFLDPFGLTGLDAATYPKMLVGGHNEIFALFSDIGAARLRGVVHAHSVELELNALSSRPSLFPDLDAAEATELRAAADRQRMAREPFDEVARARITGAVGESAWVDELRGFPPTQAREQLILRFVRTMVASGAKYVQVLPMRGAKGNRKYCLVHCSKALKGYTAMKEAISESLNKADLPTVMSARMRHDLRMPVSEVLEFIQTRFGGHTVRWAPSAGTDMTTVKRTLLEETGVYPFQSKEIKEAITSRGWLKREKRIEVCVVPPAT